jgi:hypothetical protein
VDPVPNPLLLRKSATPPHIISNRSLFNLHKRCISYREVPGLYEKNAFHIKICDFNLEDLSMYIFSEVHGDSRDSVVGIATGYGLDDRGVGVRVPVGSRLFSMSSRPALGSTQALIQWAPGALSPGVKRPKLTTHLQLVLRPRKCVSIHPLSHMPSWRIA